MSLNLFRLLMPRQEAFVPLFCAHAKKICEAADALQLLVDKPSETATQVATIRRLESEADAVARQIFLAANRAFNAPIDREDILGLTHELDDVIDLVEDAAKAIERYGIAEFPPEMRGVIGAIRRCAGVLHDAVPLLDNVTREAQRIIALCEQVGRIEGEADEQFDAGITTLRTALREGRIDIAAYVDRKEIYEEIEAVVDKCDDVANVIYTITAKHV